MYIGWRDKALQNKCSRYKSEYQKLLDTRTLGLIGKKMLSKITDGDLIELMQEITNSPAKTKSGKLSDNSVKH